ncbi:type II toxin-antitoxin system RelE/ParE family toxin [Lusitaniella coriacea]|uniref:type II toxin-antitoxin system RelE/ParE family toxin n=1 Tax=Lusitaniella coriacea TaxID=1983105 RepID=UPI003CEAFB4D
MGRSYTNLAPGLRGMPLINYIIFYQITDDGIEILRVISGYRNLKDEFKTN